MRSLPVLLVIGLALVACQSGAPTSRPTPTPELSAAETVARASERMQAVQSAHFRLEATGSSLDLGAGIGANSLEGDAALPAKLKVKASAILSGIVLELEVIALDGQVYINNPLTQKWELLPAGVSTLGGIAPFKAASFLREAKDLTKVGKETIDGIESYRVKGTVEPAAVAAVLGATPAGKFITGELWIGVNDFLVHQARLEFKESPADPKSLVTTLKLTNFDRLVAIEAPAP